MRNKDGGGNKRKRATRYLRGLRESRSEGKTVVILEGFRMRDGFG